MQKKLYRSKTDQKLCGVCAGCGLLAYLICALIIPEKPDNFIDAE